MATVRKEASDDEASASDEEEFFSDDEHDVKGSESVTEQEPSNANSDSADQKNDEHPEDKPAQELQNDEVLEDKGDAPVEPRSPSPPVEDASAPDNAPLDTVEHTTTAEPSAPDTDSKSDDVKSTKDVDAPVQAEAEDSTQQEPLASSGNIRDGPKPAGKAKAKNANGKQKKKDSKAGQSDLIPAMKANDAQAATDSSEAQPEGDKVPSSDDGLEKGDEKAETLKKKPAKKAEPYDVPSFGYAFFLHDDRSGRGGRRGRQDGGGRGGRGRGGKLWEASKEEVWVHDKYLDDGPDQPRMMDDAPRRRERADAATAKRGVPARGLRGAAPGPAGKWSAALGSSENQSHEENRRAQPARNTAAAGRGGGRAGAYEDRAGKPTASQQREKANSRVGRQGQDGTSGSLDRQADSMPPGLNAGARRPNNGPLAPSADAFPALNGTSGSRRYLQTREQTGAASGQSYADASAAPRQATMVRTDNPDGAPRDASKSAPQAGAAQRAQQPNSAPHYGQPQQGAQYGEPRLATSFNPDAPQFQPHVGQYAVENSDNGYAQYRGGAQPPAEYNAAHQQQAPGAVASHSAPYMQPPPMTQVPPSMSAPHLTSILTPAQLAPALPPPMPAAMMLPGSQTMYSQAMAQQGSQLAIQHQQLAQQQQLMGQLQGLQLAQPDTYMQAQVSQAYAPPSQAMWMPPMMGTEGVPFMQPAMGFGGAAEFVPGPMYMMPPYISEPQYPVARTAAPAARR